MSRNRKVPIDPFVQFLMDERNFETTSEAALEIGMEPSHLCTYAKRGVRNLPAMCRLAQKFGVSIDKVGDWIAENIELLLTEDELMELVS